MPGRATITTKQQTKMAPPPQKTAIQSLRFGISVIVVFTGSVFTDIPLSPSA